MNILSIKTVTEQDFDRVVKSAGGMRICAPHGSSESADYTLYECALELKLLEEDGLANGKESRQRKIAALFGGIADQTPVVVIDPRILNASASREYRRIMEGPAKTAVRKASRQLNATKQMEAGCTCRVAVILNNGYTSLSHEELEAICCKWAAHYADRIDHLVVGGMYYHSDGFDNKIIAPFEDIPINLTVPFAGFSALRTAWNAFVEDFMTAFIQSTALVGAGGKLPVKDIVFEMEGVRYVKPAPRMGPSQFWPCNHRPRDNTTGITQIPPVARTFPAFSQEEWHLFRQAIPNDSSLQATYADWLAWAHARDAEFMNELRPFVMVGVRYANFNKWRCESHANLSFDDICVFTNTLFETEIRQTMRAGVRDADTLGIELPQYIKLVTREVGQDKVNDTCSIFYISKGLCDEVCRPIIEHKRIFFEHGLALACAYAVKSNVDFVVYTRDKTYCWE